MPLSVLLIDDDALTVRAYLRSLQSGGCRVVSAGGAAEALAVLEREAIQVIVCDVVMPGMNGVDFVRGLRERGVTLPCIMMTGSLPGDARDPRQSVLHKPFTGDALLAAVRAAAGGPAAPTEASVGPGGHRP